MKHLLFFIVLILFSSSSFCMGLTPSVQQNSGNLIVENFGDGNYTSNPEWWTFGKVDLKVVSRPSKDHYSLAVKGGSQNWYVGGIGLYLADPSRDLSKYTGLEVDIFGVGAKSGTIKIELYDDDNGNWQIEQDPKKFEPLYDDKFVYELPVAWDGWRHISIPFAEFVLANPGVGDGVWNPEVKGASGGLLQMQFIFVAASKIGKVGLDIDNIGFSGADIK